MASTIDWAIKIVADNVPAVAIALGVLLALVAYSTTLTSPNACQSSAVVTMWNLAYILILAGLGLQALYVYERYHSRGPF